MFLFSAHVQRTAGDGQAKQIAVKFRTALRAPHRHSRVVDAQKHIGPGPFPNEVALPFWKPEQLKVVPVRIAELDRLNPGSGNVRYRNRPRTRRNLFHMVLPQLPPGRIHSHYEAFLPQ